MDTILLRRGGQKYLLKVCLIFTHISFLNAELKDDGVVSILERIQLTNDYGFDGVNNWLISLLDDQEYVSPV